MEEPGSRSGGSTGAVATVTIAGHPLALRGGLLGIDSVNTVDHWHSPRAEPTAAPRSDHLSGYADLVDWARQVGTISDRFARLRHSAAERRPAEAADVFRRARRFRSALHDTIVAVER